MCAPSPPPPPDYAGAAQAQGAANVETALTQAQQNNPNVISPYGTQTWTEGDDGSRPTVTQEFSTEQQGLYDQSLETQGLLADLGTQGATALQGIVGQPLDFSGAPQVGNYDSTRQQVIDAMMSRANEDYSKQTDQSNSDLIAAGIRPGTKAYADRMQMIERAKNDARTQAEIAGGNAAAQAFATDTQARKDYIAELLSQRGVPLNEITALMSGSQVSNPFAMPGVAQNTQIAPPPIFGAAQAQGQYNASTYDNSSPLSGLFGLGGAALMSPAGTFSGPTGLFSFSDIRLKSNIVRIGDHPLGIGVYEYDIFGQRETGVMAQEVLKVKPEAVVMQSDGWLMVDYGRL